jgi:formylglycine-generating enzyme required for sulfatase activity
MVVVPGALPHGLGGIGEGCGWQRTPQHEVTIPKPFAVGTHEVSFEEYDRFAKATGRPLPDDRWWGRGRPPTASPLGRCERPTEYGVAIFT